MDNIDFIKEIGIALKLELIRYRVAASAIAVIVMVVVLMLGFKWQKQYVSVSTLFVDESNIIQPLLEGAAEFSDVDRVEEAREGLYSRSLLVDVGTNLGYISEDTTIEEQTRIINAIRSGIEVESEGRRSNSFTVSYYSRDPEVAFKTAQQLVTQLVEYQKVSRREEGEYAYDFISKQVDTYKSRLESAESALKDFRSRSTDVDEQTVQDRIRDLDNEIQDLKLSIQESESKIETTTAQLDAESEYIGAQGEIYALQQQKQLLQTQLSELRMQFQESYPDIVTIKGQIANIDSQIKQISRDANINPRHFGGETISNPELLFDELRKQISEADRELKAKRKRLVSLEELLKDQYAKLEVVAENQAELADLMRDYTVTKDVYEEMLARKENAELSVEITKEGQGLNYRVIDEPSYPLEPTGLTFIHFVVAAPILGFGMPIGMLIALILLDPRVRTVSNLNTVVTDRSNVLCVVPHYHTTFADRILRKDMLVLSVVFGVLFCVYIYIVILGLSS
jgi:polysaccharide chain length determinant protein (PEP-CTERM system associated)